MHAEDEHKPAAQAKQQENNRKIPAQKDGGGGKGNKKSHTAKHKTNERNIVLKAAVYSS